jgi:hypothetical protein
MSDPRTSRDLYPYQDSPEELAMLLVRGSGMTINSARQCVKANARIGDHPTYPPITGPANVKSKPVSPSKDYVNGELDRKIPIKVTPGSPVMGGKLETY